MFKKTSLILFLGVFILTLCGCATVKGAAKGAKEGFGEDWQAAKKCDEWMRKNLW
jgi:predicted small secreted protein